MCLPKMIHMLQFKSYRKKIFTDRKKLFDFDLRFHCGFLKCEPVSCSLIKISRCGPIFNGLSLNATPVVAIYWKMIPGSIFNLDQKSWLHINLIIHKSWWQLVSKNYSSIWKKYKIEVIVKKLLRSILREMS